MKTKTVNGVEFYQDWEHSEGGIRMVGAKTIGRYLELKSEHPDSDKYGIFFAFDAKAYGQGCKRLEERGYLKGGAKVVSAGAGMYGTREEITRYLDFYGEREKIMAKECNPQEVYFYEWNNHECMFDNDDSAMKIVISIFGNEAAHKVYRLHVGTATNILAPLTERDRHLGEYDHQLMMLARFAFDCSGFFSEGDCRYHRPDCLWGGSVESIVSEMRKTYGELPEDIRDASPLSREAIENYAAWMKAWAAEEYAKPEYDPEPRTRREDFPGEIELPDKLYYKDDNGMWQTPSHVYFTADLRRFKQDDRQVHGRAMTTYLGKKGTVLAPVYILDLPVSRPYRRDDLCDVSCRYDYKPLHSRLYDFYYE